MLSKPLTHEQTVCESIDADLSTDIFEAVMDHTYKLFLTLEEPKISRNPKKIIDYWSTNWGKWMQDPDILNPDSKISKLGP